MVGALVGLALVVGVIIGWLAHRRLSLHYKERWLQAVGQLNDKALLVDADDTAIQAAPAASSTPVPLGDSKPYVPGRWALYEAHKGSTAVFYAIRSGFDDVLLGSVGNFKKYAGLYKMNRSNAEQAVTEMNQR